MNLKEIRAEKERVVNKIKEMVDQQEVINFDDESYWKPFLDEYEFFARKNRKKYPRIVFMRIVNVMREGAKYPLPNILELKCGVCHGNVDTVRQLEAQGHKLLSYYFPKKEEIPAFQPGPLGIQRQSGWRHMLHTEEKPFEEVEQYIKTRLAGESYEDRESLVSENAELKKKLLAMEKKQKKNGNNDSNTKVSQSAEAAA